MLGYSSREASHPGLLATVEGTAHVVFWNIFTSEVCGRRLAGWGGEKAPCVPSCRMAFGLVDGVKVRGHRNFAGVLTTIIPTGDCPHLGTGRLRTPASPSQPRQGPWGTGRSSGDLDGAVHLWVLLCCTHFPAEPMLTDGPPPPISPFHKFSLTETFCGLKKKIRNSWCRPF